MGRAPVGGSLRAGGRIGATAATIIGKVAFPMQNPARILRAGL